MFTNEADSIGNLKNKNSNCSDHVPIIKDTDNPVNQSKLAVNRCTSSWRPAREKWREFFQPVAEQWRKTEEMQITFNTQETIALISQNQNKP